MTAEEESGFSFVDKRHVTQEPQPVEAPAEPRPVADPESPESHVDESGPSEHLPHLTLRDRLLMCVDILHQGAWQAMGLIADPNTGEINRDLAQAKKAIDCVAYLAGQLEADLDEATTRELKRLISDLQVNFVNQSKL